MNNYSYVYHYTDHLGNVRLSYAKDPATNVLKILEENHYYPYGVKHTNYNSNLNAFAGKAAGGIELVAVATTVPGGGATEQPYNYKFNGMEFQDELGLNLYDMDMRDYDPAIGRWTGIDPVTHHSQSTYMAMNGNPVFFADPSGADGVGMGGASINTWHYAGTGSMNGFLNGGAGNLGYGDHMLGGSRNSFWMGQGAVTGAGVSPFSLSGNNLYVNWNALPDGKTRWNTGSGDITSYIWNEGSVTYDGKYTLGEGGRLDSVNMGYWEKIAEYGGYFSDILSGKAQLDSHTFFRYGTRYASNMELMAENSVRMQSISKWAGRAGYAFTVAPVGFGLYKDNWTIGNNTKKAAFVATGNIIGAEAGVYAGAEIGAAVGVWFGGVGAVPGAIIGGVIGGFIGSYIGGTIAEETYK